MEDFIFEELKNRQSITDKAVIGTRFGRPGIKYKREINTRGS